MSYPLYFSNKVMAEFPRCDELARWLEQGHYIVGRFLDEVRAELSYELFDNENISIEELIELAPTYERVCNLYGEYWSIIENQELYDEAKNFQPYRSLAKTF